MQYFIRVRNTKSDSAGSKIAPEVGHNESTTTIFMYGNASCDSPKSATIIIYSWTSIIGTLAVAVKSCQLWEAYHVNIAPRLPRNRANYKGVNYRGSTVIPRGYTRSITFSVQKKPYVKYIPFRPTVSLKEQTIEVSVLGFSPMFPGISWKSKQQTWLQVAAS